MTHSEGNWSLGKGGYGSVVTDTTPSWFEKKTKDSGHDAIDYYGGFLIAESIGNNADAHLIAAAPELLEALTMVNDADNDNKSEGYPGIPLLAKQKIEKALEKAGVKL